MDEKLFEELLHENESTTLDFKQEQYPFAKATDDEKSELLKDILSFANAWRRTDAYILIGVQEVKGGRSIVTGIAQHIDEASLQQFVNSKTNRPVDFSYTAFFFEGKQIGIIQIPIQERPIFLSREFGRLPKHVVFIRRGSSTAIADPDEISRMGIALVESKKSPVLDIQFGDKASRTTAGNNLSLKSELFLLPDKTEIPEIQDIGMFGDIFGPNKNYYREYYEYLFMTSLLKPICFVIHNKGLALAANVRIHIVLVKIDGLFILHSFEYPDKPSYTRGGTFANFATINNNISAMNASTEIVEFDDRWELTIEMGNIQPGAKNWSEEFYLGAFEQQNIDLKSEVYSDNLTSPIEANLSLSISPGERSISVDELIRISDENKTEG